MRVGRCVSLVLLAGAGLAAACGDDGPTSPPYDPVLPTSWAAAVDNPYFPLVPGTTFEYSGGGETNTVAVLDSTLVVNGVTARVVHDEVFEGGILTEDTYDYYAQDSAGNVWYVGEDSRELEGGTVVSTEGSWEWGVEGALPGILMWADPAAHVGESYRQEYFRGEAEDWAKVLASGVAVSVPYGDFTGCVRTEDWNGLESGGHERKYYCPGVGLVKETNSKGATTSALESVPTT